MFCPAAFREDRIAVLHALIRTHPLATLVTSGSGGLIANLVPFTIVENGGNGVLRAHVARANDQLAALREGAQTMVIFQGPQSYITPSWYPSKAETGEVVPTWNYVVVQARGNPEVTDDAAWLRAQIDALTTGQEASRGSPWKVSDAPDTYIAALLKGIIGIEIPIDHIEGKWKVSQNRSDADRKGVEEGLRNEGANEAMRELVAKARAAR